MTRSSRCLAVVAILVAPILAAACSDSDPVASPDDAGVDSSSADTSSTPDVVAADVVALPDVQQQDAPDANDAALPVCTMLVESAPSIHPVTLPQNPPAGLGGTILPGVYHCTARILYTGPSGPPAGVALDLEGSQTRIWRADGTMETINDFGPTGTIPPTRTWAQTWSTSGINITTNATCNNEAPTDPVTRTLEYTVENTNRVTIYNVRPALGSTVGFVYDRVVPDAGPDAGVADADAGGG
jgi:hypothetical protein